MKVEDRQMKNITELFTLLLCIALFFTLSACGNKKQNETKTDDTIENSTDSEQNKKDDGDIEPDKKDDTTEGNDDIILPEDGKISFGDNDNEDKSKDEKNDEKQPDEDKENETEQTSDNSSENPKSPDEDTSWGEVHWNE